MRLPLPARTRLVRELKEDLAGLTRRLIDEGLTAAEARRRAAEILVPDRPTLERLEHLAGPRYRRWTAGIEPRALRWLERGAFLAATLILLLVQATVLLDAGLLDNPSPFLGPVLGLGAVTLSAVFQQAFELWVKGRHGELGRGLAIILGLSGLVLGAGLVGVLIDLIGLAERMQLAPVDGIGLVTGWLARDAALLATAILLAMAGALGWLTLCTWSSWTEQAHREALRAGPDALLGSPDALMGDPRALLDDPDTRFPPIKEISA